MLSRVIRCTLSGSYHKDRKGLRSAYSELTTCGCQVLSPHRLEFDAEDTLFVRDRAEDKLSETDLEGHHLLSIKQSDFLWVHAPNGYIGTSTSMEIGFAFANNIPVFSSDAIEDVTLRHFIRTVPSVYRALESIFNR